MGPEIMPVEEPPAYTDTPVNPSFDSPAPGPPSMTVDGSENVSFDEADHTYQAVFGEDLPPEAKSAEEAVVVVLKK